MLIASSKLATNVMLERTGIPAVARECSDGMLVAGASAIVQRPGLRPRTVELYRWLLRNHVVPDLGGVELGKLSTAIIRQWRADRLAAGVSESVTAKAYRFLRAVLIYQRATSEADRMVADRLSALVDQHRSGRPDVDEDESPA